MVRSKVQIQNDWPAWIAARAEEFNLSRAQLADLRVALASEIAWMILTPDIEAQIQMRLAKMIVLLAANDGDLTAFDRYWMHRQALLTWMLT